ncbi:excalibur calcium-binding domain-containing protein [Streptomyces sp. NPDC056944]|uniref:excalibur calcium-binding domain-containing protein n=1 Tax=Streptomyces sp. NPDC056944 TaxID=3345972 RepID=UPI003642763B
MLPPVGIGLAWVSLWDRNRKILATVLAAVWFVLPFLGGGSPEEKPVVRDDARAPEVSAGVSPSSASPSPSGPPVLVGKSLKEAKGVASAAGFDVVSHDASDQDAGQWDADNWKVCFQTSAGQRNGRRPSLDLGVVRVEAPCPSADGEKIPWPKMPAVTGMTFARAGETLKPVGFKKVEAESAYSDVELPGVTDPWKVCFQDPQPGKVIENPQYGTVYLKLAPPDAACPEQPYARLRPEPTPTPTPTPTPLPERTPISDGVGAYYANCGEAEAAGAAPMRRGEPGYRSGLDRDHDGIACDT